MHKHSLDAYDYLLHNGIRAQRYKQIIEAVGSLDNPTTQLICEFTGLPINCVSGRLTELRDKHKIIRETGSTKNQFNRKVATWGLNIQCKLF